jgi:hypothetical protein
MQGSRKMNEIGIAHGASPVTPSASHEVNIHARVSYHIKLMPAAEQQSADSHL